MALESFTSSRVGKSGRGLPQSKTLRDQRGASKSARSWSAPALWRFGTVGWDERRSRVSPRHAWAKAVEDYRSPRRFATKEALASPPGLGVRQPSGALAPWGGMNGAREFHLVTLGQKR